MNRRFFRWIYRLVTPVVDLRLALRGILGYARFLAEAIRYRNLPGAEPLKLSNLYPQLHDRTPTTHYDTHYFYSNGWAARRILSQSPPRHVDIASQIIFANLIAASLPVLFVDYRPLQAEIAGLQSLAGSLLALPFADGSVASLSCLHVIEHIGLGRYGDALDPQGSVRALGELGRVLAPGGSLYLTTPVGQAGLFFNAHRVHRAAAVAASLPGLDLVEFSGVDDGGGYHEYVKINRFDQEEYACGFFWFQKPRLQGLSKED
jgi:SAM-dependent methyltransferase